MHKWPSSLQYCSSDEGCQWLVFVSVATILCQSCTFQETVCITQASAKQDRRLFRAWRMTFESGDFFLKIEIDDRYQYM